jgi:hypothetical protein
MTLTPLVVALIAATPPAKVLAECSSRQLRITLTGLVLEPVVDQETHSPILSVGRGDDFEAAYWVFLANGRWLELTSRRSAWDITSDVPVDFYDCEAGWQVNVKLLEELAVATEKLSGWKDFAECMSDDSQYPLKVRWRHGLAPRTVEFDGDIFPEGEQHFRATASRRDDDTLIFEGEGSFCYAAAGHHCSNAGFTFLRAGRGWTLLHGATWTYLRQGGCTIDTEQLEPILEILPRFTPHAAHP